MELLVTIAIAVILMGVVLGSAGVVQRKQAEARATADMQRLGMAIAEYRAENGVSPEGLNGANPTDLAKWLSNSTYHDPDITYTDPWGAPYSYTRQGKYAYELRSAGPDRALGNTDDVVGDGRK